MRRAAPVMLAAAMFITAVFAVVTPPEVEAADSLIFYLQGNGVSWADLGFDPPTDGPLPNYDSDRNSDPGLTISRGGSGFDEFAWDKYQAWYSTAGGYDLNGEARLYLWSAVREFRPAKGSITAYLMVCNGGGGSCDLIATKQHDIDPWSDGDWREHVFSFGAVNHSIAPNKRIAVKVIVSNASSDDMWLAYDTATFDSRLVVTTGAPPTTTTTTTTTTTQPPTTTTTRPPTTTTTQATTTTTTTGPPRPTTTTTRPPSTTTTLPPVVTTTTTAPKPTTTTTRPPAPTTTTTPPPPPTTTTPPQTTTTMRPDTGLPVPPPPPSEPTPPATPDETPPQAAEDVLVVALPASMDPELVVMFRTPSAEPVRRVPVMVGLGVAFRSMVEQLGFNLLPAAILGLLTAWLMIMRLGPRRRREDGFGIGAP